MKPAPAQSFSTPAWVFRGILFAAATFVWLANASSAILPADAVFEGRTLSEWTVEAWKWIYSVPASKSPSTDCDGQWANEGQPGGSVFFIAPLNGQVPPPCIRTFTVPAGKYLLLPVLPITIDNIDTSPPLEIPAGQLLEITGVARVADLPLGSVDPLLAFDSLGGEESGIRIRISPSWTAFRLIRAGAPGSQCRLTIALGGAGRAQIDSLRYRLIPLPPTAPATPSGVNEVADQGATRR